MRSIRSFSNFHRNLVSSWQVSSWLLRFKRSSQPANRQLANQISIKMELETKNLHLRVNLLYPQPNVMLTTFISNFEEVFSEESELSPWEVVAQLPAILEEILLELDPSEYYVANNIAVHLSARIDPRAILKAPALICAGCFVGANACLRGGVFLGKNVTIGMGVEIKQSIIFEESAVAHFNFIGDSIIGNRVNFEAGSVIANHYNERDDKAIHVQYQGKTIATHCTKFGALVGDDCKIGANAVLSPGTLLEPKRIVGRLELV
jgi:UDP-N-acetylglucosamine diphosphorylase / glucose-1-phosphate thymidylyltransferase / UDP-N-acetylgalactosamine diphosphorylase / glucosamine-1-phosphate N-acetyltransferase / galactosamine-1-phosphate N-acetyltransferase